MKTSISFRTILLTGLFNLIFFGSITAQSWVQLGNITDEEDVEDCLGEDLSSDLAHEAHGSIGKGTYADNKMVVKSRFTITLDIITFLEGPFNGTQMNTNLNPGLIPYNQPYNLPPWNYNGLESVNIIPNSDIVDWVLVELRETSGDASTAYRDDIIARQAGFILSNGRIVSTDGLSPLQFDIVVTYKLFAVVHHRNHLSVLSGNEIIQNGGVYTYDFSCGENQAHGGILAHKEIGSGIWGMISGDGDSNGQINNGDKINIWLPQGGIYGYLGGDFNLDGQVNNIDKIEKWIINGGRSTQILDYWYCGKSFADAFDGNIYNSVQIGQQCWMAENINKGTMIDGDFIQADNDTIEKYCYDNDLFNCEEYGGLYQWDEIMIYDTIPGIQGICPDEWHIPTDSEFCILTQFVDTAINCNLIGWSGVDAGGRLKETGTLHWNPPNTGATNSSGFTALPGGYANPNSGHVFNKINEIGFWWSSTDYPMSNMAFIRRLDYNNDDIYRAGPLKQIGHSVRCIRNEPSIHQPPNTPSGPAPANGSFYISIDSCLSWSCSDPNGDSLLYNIYFGTNPNPPLFVTNHADTSCNPGTMCYDATYYWRIVAYDLQGDSTIGPLWYFKTVDTTGWVCGDTLTDIRDGQNYNTVLIGLQCWMAENINIGFMIPGGIGQSNNDTIEKYCYNNDPAYCDTLGGLYNWDEMMQYVSDTAAQGICPPNGGWHIPTDFEWKVLEGTVDSQYPVGHPIWNYPDLRGFDAGLKLKTTSGWYNNGNGINEYGFSVVPAGRGYSNGTFYSLGSFGYFWSSTTYFNKAWHRSFSYANDGVSRLDHSKSNRFSIRCISDSSTP